MTPHNTVNNTINKSLKMPVMNGALTQMPLIESDPVRFYESLAKHPGGLNSPLLATLFRVLSRLEQRQRDREAFARKFGGERELENIIEGLQL